jgi:hypothetical protein
MAILFVNILSAGDVKATMTANGGGSNYVLSFGVSDASQMQVAGGLLGKQLMAQRENLEVQRDT